MGETQYNPETAILLPQAGLAVFSNDEDTMSAAEYLAGDWRFARVSTQVQPGGVEQAIAYFEEHSSPDLIVIQTDVIDESFTGKLEQLAGNCDEGTGAIIIGPDNDVNLYRRLIDMGVSDYLVRPLNGPDFSEVIAKTLVEKLGVSGSRLIGFVGSKGGVGTSALAQNFAWGVADILDQKTFFLDGAGGWSVASVGLGFEPATTLAEAAGAAETEDDDSLGRMIYKASDKLHVLSSGGEMMLDSGVSASEFERLIDFVMTKYPAVLVDLSHVPGGLMYSVLNKAHHIVMVSSPAVACLRQTRSLLQEIKNVRGDNEEGISIIINMVGVAPQHELSKSDIETALGTKAATYIDFNPAFFMTCEAESKKPLEQKEGEVLIKSQLLPIVANLFGSNVDLGGDTTQPPSGLFGGLMSKLGSK